MLGKMGAAMRKSVRDGQPQGRGKKEGLSASQREKEPSRLERKLQDR